MNYYSASHKFDNPAFRSHLVADAAYSLKSMLPYTISMSEPVNDVHSVSEERIQTSDLRSSNASRDLIYETTADGDVVIVQPSFDDTSSPSKDQQARGPLGDPKQSDKELRSPSSPSAEVTTRGHSRNLSAHFFDATSINGTEGQLEENSAGRKHRRMFSNDSMTHPSTAHRRIDSIGNAANIERQQSSHRRENSGGLDVLSAAIDASKNEISQAHAAEPDIPWAPPNNTRQSASHVSNESYEYQPSSYGMNPPRPQRPSAYPVQHYVPPTSGYHPASQYHHYPYYPPPMGYAGRGPPQNMYPVQYMQRPPQSYSKHVYPTEGAGHDRSRKSQDRFPVDADFEGRRTPTINERIKTTHPGQHQGSQTYVTAIAVGDGSRMLRAKHSKNVSTGTNESQPVQSHGNHHRKMSSFSSLGTILGPSLFPPTPGGAQEGGQPPQGHHRSTSSSVSFLGDFNVGFEDVAFLRNLHAHPGFTSPVTTANQPNKLMDSPPSPEDSLSQQSSTKLAAGGTSKRVRRKCTVEGCANRVVQGGLCIAHGAKRKTCKYPGCTKNVKKAGLCSAHGPARKRCEAEGCEKVAVQGGRCIAHGARKKLCSIEECSKQAILGGMCKKHHDQYGGKDTDTIEDSASYVEPVAEPQPVHKPTHTRGLSIFQEISADGLQSLLEEEIESRPQSRKTGAW